MKYSIIVPIYNGEQWLKRCVDSVLRQEIPDWELLLIDDGSTDNSLSIAKQYAATDSRIHALHQENSGQFFARETGIRHAAGEWLLFLDCDDFWEPSLLKCLDDCMKQHSSDCIFFAANKIDEQGNLLRKVGQWSSAEQWILKEELCRQLLTCHEFNALWTKAFRRELFDGDETDYSALHGVKCGEDKVRLFHPLSRAERIFCLPEALYNYVEHPDSVSAPSAEKLQALLAEEMFRFCYTYAQKWDMDTPIIRKEMCAYYLRHFLSVYYNLRRKHGRKTVRRHPWKTLINPQAKKRIFKCGLSLREKIKLFLALYFNI